MIGKRFQEEKINLPPTEELDGCSFKPLPCYLLQDETFHLKTWLIRPFLAKNMTEEESLQL